MQHQTYYPENMSLIHKLCITNCLFLAALKKDKILLVANDYRHTVHGLDPNDLSTFYSYKLPASDRPICVTYNPVRGYLYWSEFNDGIIKGMFVDGSDVRVLRIGETGIFLT